MATATILQASFRSTTAWREGKAEWLAVHCSDYRYHAHFEEFLSSRGAEDADRIAVPGGPHCLFPLAAFPKWAWAGKKWLEFLVEHHHLHSIVLISHEGCSWYRSLHIGGLALANLADRQVADLLKVRQFVSDLFPKLTVEAYFARPQGGTVEFFAVA